jgi:phosphoribosyl-dephospho-CoA transferase
MPPLHRHQLAHLRAAGWAEVLERPWDATSRDCLRHWALQRLPLVVTRQHAEPHIAATTVALGLPSPSAWERRRIALQVPHDAIAWFDEFPAAGAALRLFRGDARVRLQSLFDGLAALGTMARVYGSHGWQLLSGLDYLHERSDLDLWISVAGPDQADAAAACLQAFDTARQPVDGELVFIDGAAVAWREWFAWRSGRARALLVKRLHGATLERNAPHACLPDARVEWSRAA